MSSEGGRRQSLKLQARQFIQNEQVILSALAVVLGAASGFAAVGFRHFIDFIQNLFYGFQGQNITEGFIHLPWWQILLVPVVGGGIVGVFIRYFLPDGKPQGVPHVIEATALRAGGCP